MVFHADNRKSVKFGEFVTEDETQPLWAITRYLGIGICYDGESETFKLKAAGLPSNSLIHLGILREAWRPGEYGSGVYFNYADARSGKIHTAWIKLDNVQNNVLNGLIESRGDRSSMRDSQTLLNYLLNENPKIGKLIKNSLPPNLPAAVQLRAKKAELAQ